MALVTVTLQILQEETMSGLSDTRFTVLDAGQTTILLNGITNQAGVSAPFSLEEGTTYKVLLSRPLTTFTVPETIVTPAAPATVNFPLEGDSDAVAPPVSPDLCRVYGFLVDLSGAVLPERSIFFQNLFGVSAVGGTAIFGPDLTAMTDEDGYFEVDIVRGATVRCTIQDTRIAASLIIPDEGTANITELLADAVQEIPEVAR